MPTSSVESEGNGADVPEDEKLKDLLYNQAEIARANTNSDELENTRS